MSFEPISIVDPVDPAVLFKVYMDFIRISDVSYRTHGSYYDYDRYPFGLYVPARAVVNGVRDARLYGDNWRLYFRVKDYKTILDMELKDDIDAFYEDWALVTLML